MGYQQNQYGLPISYSEQIQMVPMGQVNSADPMGDGGFNETLSKKEQEKIEEKGLLAMGTFCSFPEC
jgi:hypothetical protein